LFSIVAQWDRSQRSTRQCYSQLHIDIIMVLISVWRPIYCRHWLVQSIMDRRQSAPPEHRCDILVTVIAAGALLNCPQTRPFCLRMCMFVDSYEVDLQPQIFVVSPHGTTSLTGLSVIVDGCQANTFSPTASRKSNVIILFVCLHACLLITRERRV